MPRNVGTNIYIIPPDTEGIPDQTIESATYNTYIHDVETDLNTPRPIIAGGTGANDADEALVNLSGEKATQLVTNYDTHVWMPGSFRSAGSATAGPVDGHAFAGIVYLNENYLNPPTNANVVVSARDMNDTVVPGRVYVREKKADVWGAWAEVGAATTPFPPSGGLSADTVLEAIQELDAEKASIAYVDSTFAPIASPVFTGDARAPTPLVNDNDTTISTTAFVNQAVANGLALGGGSIDALAHSGMQVNGAFDVSQESGSATRGTTGYICDGWVLTKTLGGSGVVAFSRFPLIGVYPNAMTNQLVGNVSTIQSTLVATDVVSVTHRIEGYRVARLGWGGIGTQSITIGFWSGHAPAGLYSLSIHNAADNRAYVTTYTQATANVNQYNVITIPGEPNGNWDVANGIGLSIVFTFAAGTGSLQTSSINQWLAGSAIAATGQINGLTSIANSFKLAQVVVLPGVVAIPSARSALLMRPYDQELVTCQRYWQLVSTNARFFNSTANAASLAVTHPLSVEMRATPTTAVVAAGAAANVTGYTVAGQTMKELLVTMTTSAAISDSYVIGRTFSCDARL